jgi:Fe2+ or Zn2+ uptake regulation protein
MTPIETFRFLHKKDVDLTEMMILERLNLYDRPMLTGHIVDDATKNSAFASQATVFKYLLRLKKRSLIRECKIIGDARCTYIEITPQGKKLLKEWA